MAATLVKTISMQIVADPGDSKEVLAGLKADSEELSKPINLVATADTAEAQGAVDDLADATSRAAAAQERFTETQKAQAEAAARVAELQRDGTASSDELTAATDKLTDASIAAADARKNLARMTALSSDEQVAAGIKTEESAGESGLSFGKFGLIAGAALAGVAYESGKLAVGFNSDMTMISTQAGVAKSALPGLEAGVLSLAGKVGESPDSLAEALYHVESSFASVGISGPKALNLTEVAAKGAVTGHADLVDVTNALDAAVVSGIPGVQNFDQAMGSLNATVGAGDMHMEDLAQAFGTGMLATVKGFGVTLNDVGAALATFGDNNIRGAKAGTELRMAVQALGAPGTGPVAVAALKSLNLQYTTLSTDMQKGGLRLAITDLVNHLKKAGDTGDKTGEILTDAFGKKAGSGVNILVSQFGRFQSKFPDMKKGADDFGKDWQQAAETPAVKLKQLESGGEAAATSLGLVLLPALVSVLGPAVSFLNWVDGSKTKMEIFAGVVGVLAGTVLIAKLGGAVKGGIDDFKALGGMVQGAAGKLGILTGATEAQTGATEEATGAQAELDGAMDANPVGAVIFAIIALIAVTILIVTHLKDFKKWGTDAFHFVEHAASETWGWVKGHWPLLLGILTGPIGLAVGEIIQHWHAIETGAMDVVHRIGHWFDQLPGMLFTAGEHAITGLLSGIGSMVSGAESTVEGWGHDIANAIGSPFGIHFSEPSEAAQMVKAGHRVGESFAKGITESAGLSAAAAMQLERGASAGLSGGGGRGGAAGGGGDTYIFNIPEFSDPVQTARKMQQMLRQLRRRNGGADLGFDG